LRDGDKNRWVRAVIVKSWLAVFGFVIARSADKPWLAAAVVLGAVLWTYRDFESRKGALLELQVTGGRVRFTWSAGTRVLAFEELLDVRLDTRAKSKNVTVARADGVNSMLGAASNHNIDIDTSRIELALAVHEVVPIGREYISHSLCVESLRSIRLFLRKHGWKPEDERES
jgi:hypothetical protein